MTFVDYEWRILVKDPANSSLHPLSMTHPHVCIIRINKTEGCQISSGVFEVFQVHEMKILQQQKNEIKKNISLPLII